jgi:HSP20 family protein
MFAITRTRSPLAELQGLNRLVDEAFRSWPGLAQEETPLVGNWLPPVDILEDKDAVRIAAELPGVKPEDVKISMENNVLTIRGEKRLERREGNGERSHRFERAYGMFERAFTVPASVDAERIEAKYEQGVLTVTLPKVERAKPREINIKVQA